MGRLTSQARNLLCRGNRLSNHSGGVSRPEPRNRKLKRQPQHNTGWNQCGNLHLLALLPVSRIFIWRDQPGFVSIYHRNHSLGNLLSGYLRTLLLRDDSYFDSSTRKGNNHLWKGRSILAPRLHSVAPRTQPDPVHSEPASCRVVWADPLVCLPLSHLVAV